MIRYNDTAYSDILQSEGDGTVKESERLDTKSHSAPSACR